MLGDTKKFELVIGCGWDCLLGILITPALGGGRFGEEVADLAAGRGGLFGGRGLAGFPTSGMPKPVKQQKFISREGVWRCLFWQADSAIIIVKKLESRIFF